MDHGFCFPFKGGEKPLFANIHSDKYRKLRYTGLLPQINIRKSPFERGSPPQADRGLLQKRWDAEKLRPMIMDTQVGKATTGYIAEVTNTALCCDLFPETFNQRFLIII